MTAAATPDIAPAPERKHRWDRDNERWIPGHECKDGNSRTERTCVLCQMVKITVHPPQGFPWREWRTFDGQPWWGEATPPCLERRAAE